jgi:hypothetical protein
LFRELGPLGGAGRTPTARIPAELADRVRVWSRVLEALGVARSAVELNEIARALDRLHDLERQENERAELNRLDTVLASSSER